MTEPTGLMTPEACAVLWFYAAQVRPGFDVVEVGSFKGQSTIHLAQGVVSGQGFVTNTMVHAVDPWDLPGNPTGRHGFAEPETRQEFERQVVEAGVSGIVARHQAFSVDAAAKYSGRPIGLLYIDGDHSRAAVLADFHAWRPHLAPRATIIFDDWGTPKNPGVASAVRRLRLNNELRVTGIEAERLAVCVLP